MSLFTSTRMHSEKRFSRIIDESFRLVHFFVSVKRSYSRMLRNAQCDQIWARFKMGRRKKREREKKHNETKWKAMQSTQREKSSDCKTSSHHVRCTFWIVRLFSLQWNAIPAHKPTKHIRIVNRAREKYHKKISLSHLNVLTIFVIKHLTWIHTYIYMHPMPKWSTDRKQAVGLMQ